jgi:hypothetical protein
MTGDDDEDDGDDTPSSATKFKKRKTAKREFDTLGFGWRGRLLISVDRIESDSPSPPPRRRDDDDDDDGLPSPSKSRNPAQPSLPKTTSASDSTAKSNPALTSNFQPRDRSGAASSSNNLSANTQTSYNVDYSPAPSTMSLGSIPGTRSGPPFGRPVSREWAQGRLGNLITGYKDGKQKVCKMCM